MEFTSWDAGLHTIDPNSLEHHGIRGMKWGVRKYQNEDGSLTPAGMERYGKGAASDKRTSARKMTRDFNNLDKGYANVVAEQLRNQKKTAKYARIGHKAERKGKAEKAEKNLAKALKYGQRAALNNKQRHEIEKLQWKIIGKAANQGYTTISKPVIRMGQSRADKVLAALSTLSLVGSSTVGGVGVGVYRGTKVNGQQVKISKKGNGGTQVVNYANANKLAQQAREEERRRQMANVRR